ncbi:uncharacterized protein LOC142224932 [Haematobia irritans]|uniref:uncharacterized protein LOC142224932 n=1 Tax=Haematobia irritans TaxID=7368 RepID=UPI003F4F74F0
METQIELLRQLKDIGEGIANFIRNIKKDPKIRKTTAYYQDRLARLNAAWKEFEEADNQLRCSEGIDPSSEYFVSGYYDKIKSMALECIKILEHELIEKVPDAKNPPNVQSLHTENEQVGATSGHDGLISRSLGKMEALSRQLEGLQFSGQERTYYEVKMATINRLWQQIECLNDDVLDKYSDPELLGYDTAKYIWLEKEAQAAVIQLSSASKDSTFSNPEVVARPTALPLPAVTIFKFDGDYMKWISFSDLFTKMIHEQKIPNAHKMWYLKNHVMGEAASLIAHLAITEDNYPTAWQLLEHRYNNKRVMAATAIQRLLDQPSGAGSLSALKRLHDTTKQCLAALSNMGLQTSSWDPLLIHLLVKRLDKSVHSQYEQMIKNPKELQTISDFLSFLENYFHTLEAMGVKEKTSINSSKNCALTSQPSPESRHCIICKKDFHQLYRCQEFALLSTKHRLNLVLGQKLCVNCFSSRHSTKQCSNLGRCQKCGRKHHTLVHLEQSHTQPSKSSGRSIKEDQMEHPKTLESATTSNQSTAASLITTPSVIAESLALNSESRRPYILLGTALVKIKANGLETECKAILDSGSQVNLITERLVARLGLPSRPTTMSISGIGRNRTKVQHRVNISLQSRYNNFSSRLEAFVLPQIITPQPAQFIHIDKWLIPKNITLADPTFNRPGKIDILLGAEYYHQLLAIGQIQLGDNLPILQNTTLGWIASGKVSDQHLQTSICGVLTDEDSMNQTIERFWKLEEVDNTQKQLSIHDAQCEAHFNQHTGRDKEGRFIVRLPFCAEPSSLGESHSLAFNRFLSLERRLSKDITLKQQYIQFMKEYEALGHMTKVNIDNVTGTKYFIPHHCVLRPESSTTKLRVVFDASTKTSSGKSLNDVLYTGPTLQNDLFAILLRFRLPRFVFTTDIEKMFRQILIHPKDRPYQIILWRNNITEPINYFTLNTVTYGTRPAPYLAIRCLKEISRENKMHFPLAASFLEKNFYVDDGLGGADNLNTALEIQRQLQQVMAQYGFNLRKWSANHIHLLHNIPECDQEVSLDFSTDDTNYTQTLGLAWLPKADQLKVKVNLAPIRSVTKRTVTSDLARIFDPLGLLSPVVVRAKIFVQELWNLNLSWDEALHIFSDASEKAYGAAVYIRTILPNKIILVNLLCAKSRVAPLKQQTLPRLELCAAQLGANLAVKVKNDLDMMTTPTYYWTDSTIVLNWINSRSSSFHTFVANRIASIQDNTTPEQWRHVSSKDNPADIISRGSDPHQLKQTTQWMLGPFFLHGDEKHWPPAFLPSPDSISTERKQNLHNLMLAADAENFLISAEQTRSSTNILATVTGLCAYNYSTGPFVPATTNQDPLCLQPLIRTLCACNHSSGPFVPATTHQDTLTLCACNRSSGPFVPATTHQDPLCLQPPIRTLCVCNHSSGPFVPATTHQDPLCLQPPIRTLCACNHRSGPFVPATTDQDPLCLQPPIRTLCACNHSSGPFVPATTHQDPLCLQYPLCL